MRRLTRVVAVAVLCLSALALLGILCSATVQAKPPGSGGGSGGGAGKCECANLDNPVICNGGKVYPNPCVAACFGATGCVPYGG